MKTIRVLIADDHDLFRAGIGALLQRLPEVEVIAEAGNGEEALRLIDTHCPDVVLMDIMMPGLTGLEALDRVTREHPAVRVLILSMDASKPFVLRALRAGAAGYLLKNINPSELETALRAVVRGDTYLHPAVSKHVLAGVCTSPEGEHTPERLTPRQREVLRLVAEGNANKLIARKLGISVKTVEMHRAELMKALGIRDSAGLVRYAIRTGVISAEG